MRIGAAITVIAAIVRLIYLAEYSRDPTFHVSVLDTAYNDGLARQIASGKGMPPIPYFRAPGYTYFLALLRWLFPSGFFAIRLVQSLIGALACGGTAVLAMRLFSRKAAWIAGLAMAFYGPLIVALPELLSPVLIVPLNVLLLILLVEGMESGRAWWWVAAGAVAGLSAVVRPDVLPFLAAALVYAAWAARDRRRVVRQAAAFCAACAIPILGTGIRNYIAGREFVLIATQGGVNFYIGNNPQSDGSSANLPGKTTWAGGYEDTKPVAERQAGRPLTYGQASSWFFRQALSSFREHPRVMFRLVLRKLCLFWYGMELMNNRDDYAAKYFSRVARFTQSSGPVFFPFGVLAPLGIGACMWAWRAAPASRLLVIYIVSYWLTVAAFFVTNRYRLPVVPPLLILSAGMVAAFADWLRVSGGFAALARSPRHLRLAAFAALCFIFMFYALNRPLPDVGWNVERSYEFLKGVAYTQLDRPGDAIPHLKRAAELSNPNEDANDSEYVYLAEAYRSLNDWPAAEQAYRQLLRMHEDNSTLLTWLGQVLALQNRHREAVEVLGEAARRDPESAEIQMTYGLALMDSGSSVAATERLLMADKMAANAHVKYRLGLLMAADRKYEDAEQYLREALKLEPEFAPPHSALARLCVLTGRKQEAQEHIAAAIRLGDEEAPALARELHLSGKQGG